MKFYRTEPTPRTSWRLAVLMGVNTRTYKFALGKALLDSAATGAEDIPLADLAARYSMEMASRSAEHNQAPERTPKSESDFLTILDQERAESLKAGEPTPLLLDAAVRSIPGMVMVKFHNLRGMAGGALPHQFYELRGSGSNRTVVLTPDLKALVGSPETALLTSELDARWSLVESAFDSGIGRSLITAGVDFDAKGELLVEKARRAPVANARPALEGFQHGRCFYCHQPLAGVSDVHVDHVYPFALMTRPGWRGPNLNGVWNLVVAHGACNLVKLARLPTSEEVGRLIDRDVAVLNSPHPLKRSIQLATGVKPGQDPESALALFFTKVDAAAHFA